MDFVMSLCTRVLVLAEGQHARDRRAGRGARRSERDRGLSWPLTRSVELDGVVAGYGAMTILNGLSFAVRRGAITTVIGPNGAGKSTAFKAIFGLLRPRSGAIRIEGREPRAGPSAS